MKKKHFSREGSNFKISVLQYLSNDAGVIFDAIYTNEDTSGERQY